MMIKDDDVINEWLGHKVVKCWSPRCQFLFLILIQIQDLTRVH